MTGINVIGHVSGGMGMGLTVRNTVHALLAKGFDVAVFDVDAGHGRAGQVRAFESRHVAHPDLLPFAINVFVLGPQVLAHGIVCRPEFTGLLSRPQSTNAAYTFWELPVLPKGWALAMEVFDIVIAGSPFVGRALEVSLSNSLIVDGLHPMILPSDIAPNRRKFDLPADAFVAVLSFDPYSDVNRKNPQAAIEAFRKAFPSDERARLVINLNLSARPREGRTPFDGPLQAVLDDAVTDARIRIIDTSMSYAEVLSLYASADVFLSLHRSEGFGLGLIEAMALGKPVVATGWSGNRAFMNLTNSCMVRYRLTPVRATNWAYVEAMRGLDPIWAEPDVAHAATWLRRLAADPALASRIGCAAREAADQYRRAAEKVGFMDQVIALREHQLASNEAAGREDAMKLRLRKARRTIHTDAQTPMQRISQSISGVYRRHIGWRLDRSTG
jgi:glycosyltransferase involved in cell wall biosynthesis